MGILLYYEFSILGDIRPLTNLGGGQEFGRAIQLVKSEAWGRHPKFEKAVCAGLAELIPFDRLRKCRRQFLPGVAHCRTDERVIPNSSLRDENTESFRALISGTVIGISRLDLAERPRCA
jgi:hypothetical protein